MGLQGLRGAWSGEDAYVGQQEGLDRAQRELGFANRWVITTTKTGDYRAKTGELVVCDPTDRAFVVWLPIGGRGGDQVAVHNGSASVNAITITPTGGFTVLGAATYVIVGGRETLVLVRDARRKDWIAT